MSTIESELPTLFDLASELGQELLRRDCLLSTAESCTGGMVSAAITAVPGSSQWFDRGFVTYSNLAKMDMLDVSPEVLETYGAVSEQTAVCMTEGVLLNASDSRIAISTTGIAGPGGGTAKKPVGMVCFALSKRVEDGISTVSFTQHFDGDRHEVRQQATYFILQTLFQKLRDAVI